MHNVCIELFFIKKLLFHFSSLQDGKGTLPDNAVIAATLAKDASLSAVVKKRVMPFVSDVRTAYNMNGVSAFNTRSPFDECALLMDNAEYLCQTLAVCWGVCVCVLLRIILQLNDVRIVLSSSDERMADVVCPQHPVIEYLTEKHVPITLINPQVFVFMFLLI
jgi:hypothetical protein